MDNKNLVIVFFVIALFLVFLAGSKEENSGRYQVEVTPSQALYIIDTKTGVVKGFGEEKMFRVSSFTDDTDKVDSD